MRSNLPIPVALGATGSIESGLGVRGFCEHTLQADRNGCPDRDGRVRNDRVSGER